MKKVYFIIAAGGVGRRFGGLKQYASVGGDTLIELTLKNIVKHCEGICEIGAFVVASPASEIERISELCQRCVGDLVAVIKGGDTRAESVARAFSYLEQEIICSDGRVSNSSDENEYPEFEALVAVHDACRPFVGKAILERIFDGFSDGEIETKKKNVQELEEKRSADFVAPALPITDTIKKSSAGFRVLENGEFVVASKTAHTVPREEYFAVQTPQVMTYDVAKKIYSDFQINESVTDDSTMAERCGFRTSYVLGDRYNIKITKSEDLEFAEFIYSREC